LQSDLPPLARASSVAYPGRVACRSTFRGKTSHAQESSNDGITRRDRCILFACFGARYFTGSQARSQKSGGWRSRWSGCIAFTCRFARRCAQNKRYSQESGDSDESFAVAWQILAWRPVQAKKFCGSQSGNRDRRRRKEQKRRGSG
jgi:hypothetical protein